MAIFDTNPYRGFDVLVAPPNEEDSGQMSFERIMKESDNDTSLPVRYDSAQLAFPKQRYVWYLRGRNDYIRFLRFLYRIRGRQKAFWVPSFSEDMRLLEAMGSGETAMEISNIGIASATGVDAEMKHLIFFMRNGSYRYRRVLSSVLVSDDAESVVIDKPFSNGIAPADVDMICFLRLMRLDTDEIEINHKTDVDGLATCATTFKTAWDLRNVRA